MTASVQNVPRQKAVALKDKAAARAQPANEAIVATP